MTGMDVQRAVKALLENALPKSKVYEMYVPKDFVRPSLYLTRNSLKVEDVNAGTVQKTAELFVLINAEWDRYNNTSPDRLAEIQEAILSVFCNGRIQVGDRCVRCTMETGQNPSEAWVTITATWWDERGGKEYPYLNMGDLRLKYTKNRE